jgi:hypothetical protein
MRHIHAGNHVDIAIKPLVPSGSDRLVVSVNQGIVEDSSEDGINRALGEMNQVVIDVQNAQFALVKVRQEFIDDRLIAQAKEEVE